ncbi:MAG: GNAT family N-acetyltransferase [Pseudomonadota bacterium]
MTALQIRPMSLDDLRLAVDWAAAEGWNPGHEDADAFHAVDPDGFLMGWVGDTPVTAISVVRHSESFGFLGFYLCVPDDRGKGYGIATWRAGIAHLGNRLVGLDGVPAQEANYQSSGFALAHYTKRYAGGIDGKAHPNCRPATSADMPKLLQMDSDISVTNRSAYLSAWLSQTETRQTFVHDQGGEIQAFGTIRTCREGHKIGPLFAPDKEIALGLINAIVAAVDADEVMIDIPDPNGPAIELAGSLGMVPVFSCARMYRGEPLVRQIASVFGETTFELG